MISSFSSNNWVILLFIFLIGILVLTRLIDEIRFSKFISLNPSNEYLVDYSSEYSPFNTFNLLLFTFQIGNFSLLILKFYDFFYEPEIPNSSNYFIRIAGMLFLFYFIRYGAGKILGIILDLQQDQEILSFVKMSYLSKIAIITFPLTVFMYYYPTINPQLIYTYLTIIVIIFSFKYLQILFKNQKMIFKHLFYFILYLCALEIIPLALVFKLFIYKG